MEITICGSAITRRCPVRTMSLQRQWDERAIRGSGRRRVQGYPRATRVWCREARWLQWSGWISGRCLSSSGWLSSVSLGRVAHCPPAKDTRKPITNSKTNIDRFIRNASARLAEATGQRILFCFNPPSSRYDCNRNRARADRALKKTR